MASIQLVWKKNNAVELLPFLIVEMMFCVFVVIPELVIKMNPQFDFSVPSGDNIYLQCTVSNPESLYHVTNGRIVFMKNGSLLSGLINNMLYLKIVSLIYQRRIFSLEFPGASKTNSQSSVHFNFQLVKVILIFPLYGESCQQQAMTKVDTPVYTPATITQFPCPSI